MVENEKTTRLRALHRTPTRQAQGAALAVKVAGSLLLAAGALLLTDLAAAPAGIALCLLGWGLTALSCPVHDWVLARQRRRIAPEILRLTEELLL